ncbi:MAG: GTPase [Nanoarchaeota archaeon]|nr:GTPase [Nanoarchaeota archaeon]
MPINAHPDFLAAEKEHLLAQTPEEKIKTLEKMISFAPKHKGGENLRAQLKTRLKKLKEKEEKSKNLKRSSGSKQGIKKEEMQAILVGFSNSGKSSILNSLTNVNPEITEVKFATKTPLVGMMNYSNTNIQLIENPPIDSEFYDKGLTNTADTLLLIVDKIEQIKKIKEKLENSKGKAIIVFNKIDLLNEQEKRKISATLQSKKYNFILFSSQTQKNLEELKDKIFKSFNKIRIYTKTPNSKDKKSEKPIVLNQNSTIKDVAEKILKGFSNKVKETKIWGPSSKFPGQKVGLKHIVKDLDIVEFRTK